MTSYLQRNAFGPLNFRGGLLSRGGSECCKTMRVTAISRDMCQVTARDERVG